MRAFVERYGLESMPQVADVDDTIWARYGVRYQPAWVFIDDDGSTETYAGELAGPALDGRIQELLDR
jgi:hypothetical protein